MDENNDGKVTESELENRIREVLMLRYEREQDEHRQLITEGFAKIDNNADGVLTKEEIKESRRHGEMTDVLLARFDFADADGAPGLSENEYLLWTNPELSGRKNEYELWDAANVIKEGDLDKSGGISFKEYYHMSDPEVHRAKELAELVGKNGDKYDIEVSVRRYDSALYV
jgi:Ca2+-binding EF-hand superfamily protein